jgi:vacuolar-type H+-ATPase subunit E/Vma4
VLAAKNALRPEISRLLGDEGKAALERLETINESTELRTFVGKLVELVKLYAGKPASERFAAQFQKWL